MKKGSRLSSRALCSLCSRCVGIHGVLCTTQCVVQCAHSVNCTHSRCIHCSLRVRHLKSIHGVMYTHRRPIQCLLFTTPSRRIPSMSVPSSVCFLNPRPSPAAPPGVHIGTAQHAFAKAPSTFWGASTGMQHVYFFMFRDLLVCVLSYTGCPPFACPSPAALAGTQINTAQYANAKLQAQVSPAFRGGLIAYWALPCSSEQHQSPHWCCVTTAAGTQAARASQHQPPTGVNYTNLNGAPGMVGSVLRRLKTSQSLSASAPHWCCLTTPT